MKQTILFSLLMLLGSAFPQLRAETRAVIAEEGKTWWYSQKHYLEAYPSIGTEQVWFGLTVRSTTEIDGEQWHKVMYVDESGNDILSFPVAYLRETEEGCYVLPGIDTQEKLDAAWEVVGLYGDIVWDYLLHYPGKYGFSTLEEMREVDCTQWPVLLYPRDPQVGEEFSYGWMEHPYYIGDPARYIKVKECGWYDDSLRSYTCSYVSLWGQEYDTQMVEGVGFTDAKEADLFLFPFQFRFIMTSSDFRPQLSPVLEKVTDASGKVVYHSPDWDNYPSMLSDGKVWNYTEVSTSMMGEVSACDEPGFHFGTEKEIDGKTYVPFMDGEDRVFAYLRQEGPRVYIEGDRLEIRNPGTMEVMNRPEWLLYDFSLKVGDRFETLGFDYVGLPGDDRTTGTLLQAEVVDTYEKEVNGVEYSYQVYDCYYNFEDPDPVTTITVIKGFGPQSGYVCFPGTSMSIPTGWHSTSTVYLTSVTTKDGEILWDDPSGVETVEADGATPASDAIYDLHGRRVANPQPGSIYIRGGKKILW